MEQRARSRAHGLQRRGRELQRRRAAAARFLDAARLPSSGNGTGGICSSIGAAAATCVDSRGLARRVDGATAACLRARICRWCAWSADLLAPTGEDERRAEPGLLQGRCGAAVLGAGRRMRESCTRTRRLPTPFALLVSLLLTSRWALAGALLRSKAGAQPRASLSPPPAHDCGLWSRWSRPARP